VGAELICVDAAGQREAPVARRVVNEIHLIALGDVAPGIGDVAGVDGIVIGLLQVGKVGVARDFVVGPHRLEAWALDIPFGIYLGWISVATIANISALGVVTAWNGFGLSPVVWTITVILVGVLLAFAMIVRQKEIAYPLVLVWAFAGIFVVRQDIPAVGLTAAVAAVAIFVFLLGFQLKRLIKISSK
jgi:hypothetical protein